MLTFRHMLQFSNLSGDPRKPDRHGRSTRHVLPSSGEHSYAVTRHTSTVASSKLHPIISPWSWFLASYDRGGSQRVPRRGSAQNWPGRLSMTVIAGSVVDDLPSGTRDDTHRASLCFHECTWGILILVLLLSLWLPRSPSLPLPPRWLHHDMPASGTASTITASGSRFCTRHQICRIAEADHQCLVAQNEGKPGSRSRRVPPREDLHGNCNHLPVLPTDHDQGRRLSPLWSSCRSRQYVSWLPRSPRRL